MHKAHTNYPYKLDAVSKLVAPPLGGFGLTIEPAFRNYVLQVSKHSTP